MCEVKVETECVSSKPASQYEDIIDGFAFVSFACEGELKEFARRQLAARPPPPDDCDDGVSLASLSRQSSVSSVSSSLHPAAGRSGRGSSPGVFSYWRSGDGSLVVDATTLRDVKEHPVGERSSKGGGGGSSTGKKPKKSASIAGSSAITDGNKLLSPHGSESQGRVTPSVSLTTDSSPVNNGISLLLAAAESEESKCECGEDTIIYAGDCGADIKPTAMALMGQLEVDTSSADAVHVKTEPMLDQAAKHSPSQQRPAVESDGGQAAPPASCSQPTHSSPTVHHQHQSASSSSLFDKDSKLTLSSAVVAGQSRTSEISSGLTAGSSGTAVSGGLSFRRSPPPSGRAEFTKPVAIVSGSRIDDVDKKHSQTGGSTALPGSVSPSSQHRHHPSLPHFRQGSPGLRHPGALTPSSSSSSLPGHGSTLPPQSPFGYSPYASPSPFSSLVPPSSLPPFKPPSLGLNYSDIMSPPNLQGMDLREAQHRLNEHFLQDRARGCAPPPLSPFLSPADLQRQLSSASSRLFPSPQLDKMMEYEHTLRQQMSGYLPLALPPMDMSRNRVGGTGLDLSAGGGPVSGSLTGAFQPKAVSSTYGPFDPLYLSAREREREKPAHVLPSEPKKRGRWCAAHVQIAFQIHIAKQCARLEGRERPDRWSSGSIDLLRTPGRSDFVGGASRGLTDPLRPTTILTSDLMRAPALADAAFKVPPALGSSSASVDALRSMRELELLRSSADLLRGSADVSRAPSRADLLRSASQAELWTHAAAAADDVYGRPNYLPPPLSYLMGGLRPGDVGLPLSLQGRGAMDAAAAAAYRNAGSLFGLAPPSAGPLGYPPSLGLGALGAFGSYKDGLSRAPPGSSQLSAPSPSDASYADFLYRKQQQLLAGGGGGGLSGSEHKSRSGSASTDSRQGRDGERSSGGSHGDRERDSDRRHSSSSEHGSLANRSGSHHSSSHSNHSSSSRHHDDRHRSRSPGRQSLSAGHKSPGGHKDPKVGHASSRLLVPEPQTKVPRFSGAVDVHSAAGNRESRDGRDRRDALPSSHSPNSSSRQQLPSHSHSRDSNGGRSLPNKQPTERSRSRSPTHTASSIDRNRQALNDRHRPYNHGHTSVPRENGSSTGINFNSSNHTSRVSSSGQLLVPGSAAATSSERPVGQQQHLPLPLPDALSQAHRAAAAASLFALPDMYSGSAAASSLSLMPKADMLFMPRNASVDPVSLLGHMTPSNSGRLPM